MPTSIRNFFLHLLINASIFLHSEHEYINSCNLSVRRYYHFIQEQIFVKNITNICDRLRFDSYPYSKQFVQTHTLNSIDKIHISVFKIRFKDRPVRKLFLRRDLQLLTIPPLTYIPLGNSTDSVQVIRRCIHSEGIAFNTKGTQRVYTVSSCFHSTTSTITTNFFIPNETLPVLQPLVLLCHYYHHHYHHYHSHLVLNMYIHILLQPAVRHSYSSS